MHIDVVFFFSKMEMCRVFFFLFFDKIFSSLAGCFLVGGVFLSVSACWWWTQGVSWSPPLCCVASLWWWDADGAFEPLHRWWARPSTTNPSTLFYNLGACWAELSFSCQKALVASAHTRHARTWAHMCTSILQTCTSSCMFPTRSPFCVSGGIPLTHPKHTSKEKNKMHLFVSLPSFPPLLPLISCTIYCWDITGVKGWWSRDGGRWGRTGGRDYFFHSFFYWWQPAEDRNQQTLMAQIWGGSGSVTYCVLKTVR